MSDTALQSEQPRRPSLEHHRYRGFDVFRGAVLSFLAVLVFTPTTGWRGHAAWWGWRPSDVFFPAFLLTAGAGLAFQSRRQMPWPRLVRRFVSLMVLGLLLNAFLVSGPDLAHLRYPGVLQRIAVVGLTGALVATALRRRWELVVASALVLAVVWGVLLHNAAAGCPEGEAAPKPACGTFVGVDETIFDVAHIYHRGASGHDPEGVASTLGALASFLAGFAAGRLLLDPRLRSHLARVGGLAGMAAAWLVVTPALTWFAPFGKRLWTPSFVSLNASLGVAACAALVWALDAPARSRLLDRVAALASWPFEAVGRNALVLWLGLQIVDTALRTTTTGDGRTLAQQLLDSQGGGGYFVLLFGSWLATAFVMHAARWHIRL